VELSATPTATLPSGDSNGEPTSTPTVAPATPQPELTSYTAYFPWIAGQ
jgi:hypothetical protein